MFRPMPFVCAVIGLVGLAGATPADDRKDADDVLKKDAEALQGRWERVMTTDAGVLGRARRAVQEIQGDQEKVTWNADKDEVIRSHRVRFRLSESGKARVFTWTDMEVLDGLGKGVKPPVRGSHLYRFESGPGMGTTTG